MSPVADTTTEITVFHTKSLVPKLCEFSSIYHRNHVLKFGPVCPKHNISKQMFQCLLQFIWQHLKVKHQRCGHNVADTTKRFIFDTMLLNSSKCILLMYKS